MWREVFNENAKCIALIAIGGGGDIVSAAVLGESIAREGLRVVLASTVWERITVDPLPGPTPLNALVGVEPITEWLYVSKGYCLAIRGTSVYVPQPCRVSRLLNRPVYLLDLYGGEVGLRRAVDDLLSYTGCDAVIGVDVGGDVAAQGHEDNLWSPLADQVGLAAIANSVATEALIAIHSPGADGELPQEYIINALSHIIACKGYKWIRGLTIRDLELLRELVKEVKTEASRVPLVAFQDGVRELTIRGGSRRFRVNMINLITVLLDARKLYDHSPMAKIVTGTTSIYEAKERLNDICVYTELDLEQDLELHISKGEPIFEEITYVREKGRQQLRQTCKPL